MPPASAVQGINPNPDRGLGISSLLGTDYERRKQKLQQELQSDYKHYVTQRKDMITSGPHPQLQGLSLPIDEKTSAKEKLREERKKEYNLFLQERGQIGRLKRGTPPITSKPGQVQSSDAAPPLPTPNTHTNTFPPYRERPASRRDAATLTEAVDGVKSTGTWDPSHRRQRRRWLIYRPTEPYSSEEEPITDREEELGFGRRRRRKGRYTPEPEGKEERRVREHRENSRAPRDVKEQEAPGVRDLNNNDGVWKSDTSPAARPIPATSKDKAEFATGLLIGATEEEQAASQTRKEQYKQELLKQIAEEQRNKIREKKLELRVAATGATNPEKTPDRIKQFGAVNCQRGGVPYALGTDDRPAETTEQRGPPGRSQVEPGAALSRLDGHAGTGAAQGVPSLRYLNEDYNRDFYNMLGEVGVPRAAGAPPPIPPTVTDNYRTPYDDAYYYYGTRNPLDPDLPHYQNVLPGWVQQSGNLRSPPHKPPPLRPGHHSESTGQPISMMSPLRVGELPVDKSKQKRESALSYQEALRQQIKEREERKRQDKEEKEQYDAKLEAQMKAYNPWGRSGGGAPIKDQEGNLFSDLKQLRRISEESHRNPGFKSSEQSVNSPDAAGGESRAPVSLRLSALNDQPTPPQLHMQEKYKVALKQQIEENKRKQADERARQRMEEEREEKRVSEERTRMQRRYEEEEERQQTKIAQENQRRIIEPAARRQEEEKKVRQEQEAEEKVPQSSRDREEERAPVTYERETSPPVPALQRKQTTVAASRPSSVVSQVSPRSERSVSAPHDRPAPVRTPQPQDGHRGVIRELSALRRYLRKEQEQLEVQMGRTDRQESLYTPPVRPRRRPRAEDFESARREDEQPSTVAARVNMQNIREFNQLKYRDSASREEVLHVYPDPPTDAQSLDIQQQALLREQQRRVRLTRREEDHDSLDQQLSRYHQRNKPGRLVRGDSMLPSENAFIDVYSGEEVPQRRPPQPSAERQERTSPRRRHDCDISADQRERDIQPDAPPQKSSSSPRGGPRVGGHDLHSPGRRVSYTGEHDCKSGRLSDDEVDVLSLRSALERRVSMETIATEAWLRPGTSSALRRSACRETPRSGMDAPLWLTHHIT